MFFMVFPRVGVKFILKKKSERKLQPHPKNPRLIMREDVVAGIMAGIDNGFHESASFIYRFTLTVFQLPL